METVRELWAAFKGAVTGLLHWVESFADHPSGDWALFLIAFAESSVFPIPPDVLLIPLCLGSPEDSFRFAAICSVGSVLGGIGGYAIGHVGGRPVLRRFFNEKRVAAVASYYERYNAWATGIAGLTPLPYKLFTISGGAFGINFKIFLLASVISRSLRFFVVATLLYFYGEEAKVFIEKHLDLLSILFVILLVLGFLILGRGVGRTVRTGDAEPSRKMRSGRKIIVTGRVQGVWFRDFTRRRAVGLGLAGTVRNRSDGTVEVRAWGAETALDELERALRQGPPAADVRELDSQPLPGEAPGAGFEIVH